MITRKIIPALAIISAALFSSIPAISLAELDIEVKGDNERATAKRISAVITDIDPESRQLTLQGSLGNLITITAGPEITRFEEFMVGDVVQATYATSISGELRDPTEEELAMPVVELDAAALNTENLEPGAAVGRVVRAVCTIEGMNRITRTVMLKDPEGDFHILGDVDPEKMAGVVLGQTIIVTYTEAFALTLEKQASAQ